MQDDGGDKIVRIRAEGGAEGTAKQQQQDEEGEAEYVLADVGYGFI